MKIRHVQHTTTKKTHYYIEGDETLCGYNLWKGEFGGHRVSLFTDTDADVQCRKCIVRLLEKLVKILKDHPVEIEYAYNNIARIYEI